MKRASGGVTKIKRSSHIMPLDNYHFRPITFQGTNFPPTLMAISILEAVLEIANNELGEWLWRFPICCGFPKTAPADQCARCAREAADLMLEQRQRVLDGIRDRLASHGFDPQITYSDWLLALQRIAELSKTAGDECSWSAPTHPRDALKSAGDFDRLLQGITKHDPGKG
jgi:hypothetical protein